MLTFKGLQGRFAKNLPCLRLSTPRTACFARDFSAFRLSGICREVCAERNESERERFALMNDMGRAWAKGLRSMGWSV